MADKLDLGAERREYRRADLHREDLLDCPIAQFERWLAQAKDAEVPDATAMTLATVDAEGMPYQRMVLLKGVDDRGFVFFTNLGSRKSQHIAHNDRVCLHFAWLALDRQVIINGRARKLGATENMRYFLSRPRESQLAALASRQSHPISARRLLEEKFLELKKTFADRELAAPSFWGGYCIEPSAVEFWQGGEYRLHDRFLYSRDVANAWSIQRLSP